MILRDHLVGLKDGVAFSLGKRWGKCLHRLRKLAQGKLPPEVYTSRAQRNVISHCVKNHQKQFKNVPARRLSTLGCCQIKFEFFSTIFKRFTDHVSLARDPRNFGQLLFSWLKFSENVSTNNVRYIGSPGASDHRTTSSPSGVKIDSLYQFVRGKPSNALELWGIDGCLKRVVYKRFCIIKISKNMAIYQI